MSLKKHTFLICIILLVSVMFLNTFAVPSAVTVSDVTENVNVTSHKPLLNADGYVEIDIGERLSQTNIRFAEVCGIQTVISENSDKFYILPGDDDILVEIVEKENADTSVAVKTQYFYVSKDGSYFKLDMDNYMLSCDETSIRTSGYTGIRFKSYASVLAKQSLQQFVIDEYGYIVGVKETLGEDELTLEYPKYVKGVAYNREDGTDIVFDSTSDEIEVFTGVVKNVPVENYKTDLVCKTYTLVTVGGSQFAIYGEPVVGNLYDAACSHFKKDYTNIDVAKIIFDYMEYTDEVSFGASYVTTDINGNLADVNGVFNNSGYESENYSVYLVSYDVYGTIFAVNKSESIELASGENTFSESFVLEGNPAQVKAFVVTDDLQLIAKENKINWKPADSLFYDILASGEFQKGTDFAQLLIPDEGVSLIEGVTIASNLHSKYLGKEIGESTSSQFKHTLEMDDSSVFVDLSDRNSVNLNGINLNYASGGIDEENGYLYGTSVPNPNGVYDPQVVINGLSLDSRNYNKISVRMKIETVSGGSSLSSLKNKSVQVFFKTSEDSSINEAKSKRYSFRNVTGSLNEWFEFELEMGALDSWSNAITGIRFDPFDANAKFYIDHITFSKSDSTANSFWYDKYLDYAYENGIITLGDFSEDEFERKITREEFLELIVRAVPEEELATVNYGQFAVPDVDKNRKNAEIFLMLYRAGITLGFDKDGNLKPEAEILRSDVSAIINRLLVKENRLVGTVLASWEDPEYIHDIEFNDSADENKFDYYQRIDNKKVSDGNLSFDAKYDSYMYNSGLSIDADKYTKLKIRIKADYANEPASNQLKTYDIFFKPENYKEPITNYQLGEVANDYYLDAAGWYIFELDLCLHPEWEGNINYFRFDPMNAEGSYKIDYIRFIKSEYADYPDQDSLIAAGYKATRLMPDEYFENGFYVSRVDQSVKWNYGLQDRKFTDYCSVINPDYNPETDKPFWTIGPWWQGTGEGFEEIDLYESRDTTTGVYTLADTFGVNRIVYNPEFKSISQTLNASKIYNGKPHIADDYQWWPHQLLDTNANYSDFVDKEVNSADADRMFVELDIRMTDFEDNDDTDGMQVCSYLAYFYLRPKAQPNHKIWFGLTLFSGANLTAPTNVKPNWAPDSAAHQYMYGMPQAVVYDGIENSFNPEAGVADVGDEWKHIRLDITPHIDRALAWANRDNIFGFEVSKEDMFFNGVNIGFETHGNFDATFEIKNFNLVSYKKP